MEEQDSPSSLVSASPSIEEADWQGELAQRLKAYRTRRRKHSVDDVQSKFPFEETAAVGASSIALAEAPAKEDFSFTIAIGRPGKKLVQEQSTLEIDVSSQARTDLPFPETPLRDVERGQSPAGLYPVAPIEDRRIAAAVDLLCLLFAYGGFLGLFGSLGGQFTLSKMSLAVCAATFATVYLQYFALFTIFGGTTPGMMMRNLQVVGFSGDPPSPKQMLLRSLGYLLSAGAFFLGFFWALWDEDELTWHDRLSHTYLSAEQRLADFEAPETAQQHGQ